MVGCFLSIVLLFKFMKVLYDHSIKGRMAFDSRQLKKGNGDFLFIHLFFVKV